MSHQRIAAFMDEYYRQYNSYRQHPAGLDCMDEYWSPDFTCLNWVHTPGGGFPQRFSSLAAFKEFLHILHAFFDERLSARQHVSDSEAGRVATQLLISNYRCDSQQLISQVEACAIYTFAAPLAVEPLRIRHMELFVSDERQLRKPFRGPLSLARLLWRMRRYRQRFGTS